MAGTDHSGAAELAGLSAHAGSAAVEAESPPPPHCADCARDQHEWAVGHFARQTGYGLVRLYRRRCVCRRCACDAYGAVVVVDAPTVATEPTEDLWPTRLLPVLTRPPVPPRSYEQSDESGVDEAPWLAPSLANDVDTMRAVLRGLRNLPASPRPGEDGTEQAS